MLGSISASSRNTSLAIERIDLEGGAKLHQAMVAGSIDVALGGGTDLAFLAKGSPEKAVAVLGTSPANFAILEDEHLRRSTRLPISKARRSA